MKSTMKMALAFATLSAFAGTAYAQDGDKNAGGKPHGLGIRHMSFETLDADKTGDITFEEFKKAAGARFELADTNKDGKVTVEEMAAAIEKARAERMASRMIKRFDVNGDGAVTLSEIETNQQEMYAMLDRNNDGKLVQDEMPKKRKGWFGKKGHQNNDNN